MLETTKGPLLHSYYRPHQVCLRNFPAAPELVHPLRLLNPRRMPDFTVFLTSTKKEDHPRKQMVFIKLIC